MSFYGGSFYGGGFFGARGGKGRRRERQDERWSLTVDGEAMVFANLDALIGFLDRQEAKHVKDLVVSAEKDAQRIIRVGRAKANPAPPKVRIESTVEEIRDYAADVQAKVDRMYWKALAEALAREAEEEADIKYIAKMLDQ